MVPRPIAAMEASGGEVLASRDGVRLAGAAFAANYVGRAKVRRRARSAAAMPQMGQTIHSADHRLSCGRRLMVQYCCRQRLRGESPRQYLHMVLESSRLSTYIDTLQVGVAARSTPACVARRIAVYLPRAHRLF